MNIRALTLLFLFCVIQTIANDCTANELDSAPYIFDDTSLERMEKTANTVTIYRDTYGVPHVFGKTDASTVFGFMYARAEDRFFRFEPY